MKKIISCIVLTVLFFSCSKKELTNPSNSETISESPVYKKGGGGSGSSSPIVTTTSEFGLSTTSVRVDGNITYSGSGSINKRGFCYKISSGPTIADYTTLEGSGVGGFYSIITGLTMGTTYYVKAYAIKGGTVYYGNELSFSPLTLGLPSPGPGDGTVTDIDGNIYHTRTYGTQVWMIENLKTTRYRDGVIIPNITDNSTWSSLTSGAYCDYDNNPSYSAEYGKLYNSYAATNSHNIAPTGWHTPTFGELLTLFRYLGGGDAGGRMKETGYTHWLSPNTLADNTSEFTALGSGQRNSVGGAFYGLQTNACFWSNNSTSFIAFYLRHDSGSYTYSFGTCADCYRYGFSIRCIKD